MLVHHQSGGGGAGGACGRLAAANNTQADTEILYFNHYYRQKDILPGYLNLDAIVLSHQPSLIHNNNHHHHHFKGYYTGQPALAGTSS